ncbi:hypothetical protein BH23CHL2_BH23CHL2_14840 [soil metagenome]
MKPGYQMAGSIELGIDIGGTFTDFIAVDPDEGDVRVWKTLTTPDDPTAGVLQGLQAMFKSYGLDTAEIGKLVHATTLITNSLIERKGARTALVTTAGFADLIEIGREVRYDLYDIFLKMPEPLVPADWRYEVAERIDHNGSIITPLDEDSLTETCRLLQDSGVESVAVCFLHSYANDEHERRAADLIAECLPGLSVSRSSEVAGEIREYERFSTTAANAYVQPLASRYLSGMNGKLKDSGVKAPLQIMLSNGGTTTVPEATRLPVRLVESGPAAGALIAAHYARMLDEPLVLAFDMGGTTAKLCAIENGQPTIGSGLEVARVHRFKKGSGLPIRAPSVELIEIGAGGGSIARIDELGLLTVGPDSAGADPGPACYGLGGESPTVSDADLLLGYLNPGFFLGGEMTLDPERAATAVRTSLADQLDMNVIDVAAGIHNVVNETMATAAGVYIAERGQDPRRFTLIATGGAGPVHAVEVARKLGIGKVIVPPAAGVASAGGLLVAPPRLDFARSLLVQLDDLDWSIVGNLYEEMEADARRTLEDMGIPSDTITISRSVDARYVNQGHEITVPVDAAVDDTPGARAMIEAAFDDVYRRVFGRTVAGVPIECVTWRTTVRGDDSTLPESLDASTPSGEPYAMRPVHFGAAGGMRDIPVYQRAALQIGRMHPGPAVIEEAQSTTIVGPDDRFEVDRHGNIVIVTGEGGQR